MSKIGQFERHYRISIKKYMALTREQQAEVRAKAGDFPDMIRIFETGMESDNQELKDAAKQFFNRTIERFK